MFFFELLFVCLTFATAKVQQKMHIRKQSEKYYKKIIDFQSIYTVFITHSSSLENEMMGSG